VCKQTTILLSQLTENESGVAFSNKTGVTAIQSPRRLGEGGQHEAIPGSQHLFVAAGVHAFLASFEQLAPGLCQGRSLVHVPDEFEDVLALEAMGCACRSVAAWGDTIWSHRTLCVVAQNRADLVPCPEIEPALLLSAIQYGSHKDY
jgi:hypothetical protein